MRFEKIRFRELLKRCAGEHAVVDEFNCYTVVVFKNKKRAFVAL